MIEPRRLARSFSAFLSHFNLIPPLLISRQLLTRSLKKSFKHPTNISSSSVSKSFSKVKQCWCSKRVAFLVLACHAMRVECYRAWCEQLSRDSVFSSVPPLLHKNEHIDIQLSLNCDGGDNTGITKTSQVTKLQDKDFTMSTLSTTVRAFGKQGRNKLLIV